MNVCTLQSIKELDIKRVSQIERTWKEVNESFGKIFSTLLPGTTAKLVTSEGGCLEDGLEVKVGFGGVWKESLSELSGGQRSLIALSLVFALLKFRPAPLYILDEVRRCRVLAPCVSNPRQVEAPVYPLDIVMAKLAFDKPTCAGSP
jgi:structural maintenance of chromosome 2